VEPTTYPILGVLSGQRLDRASRDRRNRPEGGTESCCFTWMHATPTWLPRRLARTRSMPGCWRETGA